MSAPKFTYHHAAGAAVTIDWEQGSNQQVDLSVGSVPCVITSTGLPPNEETGAYTLYVQQNAAGNGSIVVVNGNYATGFALSAVANAVDLVDMFWTGHNFLVSIRGKNFT